MKPQLHMQQYPSMAPGGQYPRQQYPVGQYPAQVPPQQMVHGTFDPGARFGPGSSVNIPVSAKLFRFYYCCIVILSKNVINYVINIIAQVILEMQML